jgi:hypothetical protein
MILPKIGKLVGYPMTPIVFVIFLGPPLSYAYAPITLRYHVKSLSKVEIFPKGEKCMEGRVK